MNVVEVNRKSLGAYELYTIPPDVIVFKIRGVLGEPEAREISAYVVELVAKHGANVYAIEG